MRARLVKLVGFIMAGVGLLSPNLGAAQEKPDPIKWSVKAEPPAGALKPGDKFTVSLTAKIENGWHLYSPDQQPGGPIPTRIVLPDDQPFKLAAEIESPLPRIELDPNFNLETQFYEGEATFNLPVKIAADAQPGKQEVKVNVSYQTCNGEICLPPKRLKLAAEVSIK
jgi:DsbC/DsbD-like thiol-disulfide interchange protein